MKINLFLNIKILLNIYQILLFFFSKLFFYNLKHQIFKTIFNLILHYQFNHFPKINIYFITI